MTKSSSYSSTNISRVSKSKLAIELSKLAIFHSPEPKLEQYSTDPEIAATICWYAHMHGHLARKCIADLGCGTGILGLGTMMLGSSLVYFIDEDKNALTLAKENLNLLKKRYPKIMRGKAKFICDNIKNLGKKFDKRIDTVIMNPPFGTKQKHADKIFLETAFRIADVVYSFHKTSTRKFVQAVASDYHFNIIDEIRFQLPIKQTMKFHKKRIVRIAVSCFVMEKIK